MAYVDGTLTIQPALLTATADDIQAQYHSPFTPTVSYSGFVNGDDATALTTPVSATTDANSTSDVGTYEIDASGGQALNYTIDYVPGTLTITPAPLDVIADDQTSVYGSALPQLTYHVSGLLGDDTESVFDSPVTVSTEATAASDTGTYDVTPSGASATNYTITYNSGTLTITPAPLTITADDLTVTGGTAHPGYTATYAGLVNGDDASALDGTLAFDAVDTTTASAGTYPITPSGVTSSNYTIIFDNGVLTVVSPLPTLTVTADNRIRQYGAADPYFTATIKGFVNGDSVASLDGTLSFTPADTPSSAAGTTYAIVPSGLTSSRYNIVFVPGVLTIVSHPLRIQANDNSTAYGSTTLPQFSGVITPDWF